MGQRPRLVPYGMASHDPDDRVLIEVDGRRRLSLGRIGRHSRYLAAEEPDGTIVLTPAVVLTVQEAEALGSTASA